MSAAHPVGGTLTVKNIGNAFVATSGTYLAQQEGVQLVFANGKKHNVLPRLEAAITLLLI